MLSLSPADRSAEPISGCSLYGFEGVSEATLYLPFSQAPKSANLHRCEQKGKNTVFSAFSPGDVLIVLLQIGHLSFISAWS